MIFRYPWMLLFLLVIPLLVIWKYRRKRRPSILFSDGPTLATLPVSWAVHFSKALPVLYTGGLIALVLAIARPQTGLQESRVETEAVDIVLLVDVSTSMRAIDLSTRNERFNRLDSAKKVIEDFIENRKEDRIGAVAFAALPYSVSPLTLDHPWLLQQVNRLKTGIVEDGTAIGSALGSAVNRLRDSEAKTKLVILLTDGMNNAGNFSPENAAQAAKALGIKVYTIGAGSSGIVQIPVDTPFGGTQYVRQRSEIDEATLTRIADITEGAYFRATDFKSLKKIYEQIDEMEKTKIDIEQFTRFQEKFMPFAILSIMLLGLEKTLSLSRLGRLP